MDNILKENIGKLYIENNVLNIVVGFDFLNNKFLISPLGSYPFIIYNSIYIQDTLKLIYPEDFKFFINESLEKLDNKYYELLNIYQNSLSLAIDKNEFKNVFNRLYETNNLINVLKSLSESLDDDYMKSIYKKELFKANKGMKRALKRLYHYMDKEDYSKVYSFLSENNFPNLVLVFNNVNSERKVLNDLLKSFSENESLILDFRKNVINGVLL